MRSDDLLAKTDASLCYFCHSVPLDNYYPWRKPEDTSTGYGRSKEVISVIMKGVKKQADVEENKTEDEKQEEKSKAEADEREKWKKEEECERCQATKEAVTGMKSLTTVFN